MIKNKLHSDLSRQYRDVKRKVTSELYMLEYIKDQEWDPFCHLDEDRFYYAKGQETKDQKFLLKTLHERCRQLKVQIVQANKSVNV